MSERQQPAEMDGHEAIKGPQPLNPPDLQLAQWLLASSMSARAESATAFRKKTAHTAPS